IPVSVASKKGEAKRLESDEHIRMDASFADMAKLQPVFTRTGTITSGNSSGITDGASAIVLVSDDEARKQNLKLLARVMDYAIAGVDPTVMGIGPVPAVKKLLAKTGMSLHDFDLFEINE